MLSARQISDSEKKQALKISNTGCDHFVVVFVHEIILF